MDDINFQKNVIIEIDDDDDEYEFWPVEHPIEPMEEDTPPVNCPMPHSSLINDNNKVHERRIYENFSRKTERSTLVNKIGMTMERAEPPIQAVRKRHHALTHGNNFVSPSLRKPPPYVLPTQTFTMFNEHFNMFQH